MVAYSPTPDPDPERGDVPPEPGPPKGPWRSCSWQVPALLLLLLLSLSAVFVLVWTFSSRAEATVESGHKEALQQPTAECSDPHSALRRISSSARAAIHLEGSYEDSAPSGLQWDSGQGQGFAQGGVRLRHNQILIPESGLYFVYSQASFRVSCHHLEAQATPPHLEAQATPPHRDAQATPPHRDAQATPPHRDAQATPPHLEAQATPPHLDEDSSQRTPLSHRIWRFSESIAGEVPLMGAVRSACSRPRPGAGPGPGWYNAIYLGAVFQLRKGDRLWTETNNLHELETEDGKTFFGLFALF